MNIYLLERKGSIGYDEYYGFVICANSEQRAREIANVRHSDEGKIWNDREKVKVEEVGTAYALAEEGIILDSFNAG